MTRRFSSIFLLSILMLCANLNPHCALAQQSAQYGLWQFNTYSFNPAFAGMGERGLSINAVFRRQWADLGGSPQTQNLNAHLAMPRLGGGIGMNLERDGIGAEENLRASVSYNYITKLTKQSVLSFALSGGILQKTLNGSLLTTPEGIYEDMTISHNDPILSETKIRARLPVFDAGVYFKSNKFQAGISVLNLTTNRNVVFTNNVTNYSLLPTYFFNFAQTINIGNSLEASVVGLARTDGVQWQSDFGFYVTFNENILLGTTFRGYNNKTQDALALAGGLRLSESVRLLYAYELPLSALAPAHNGSHEVMLRYDLDAGTTKEKLEKIIHTPRFL